MPYTMEELIMKMYEAQAIIIEKETSLEIKSKKLEENYEAEIKRLKAEVARLQSENSNKSQQEIDPKEEELSIAKSENFRLSERLEIVESSISQIINQQLFQKVEKLEKLVGSMELKKQPESAANQTRNFEELLSNMQSPLTNSELIIEEELVSKIDDNKRQGIIELAENRWLTEYEKLKDQQNKKDSLVLAQDVDKTPSELNYKTPREEERSPMEQILNEEGEEKQVIVEESESLQTTSILIMDGYSTYLLNSTTNSWDELILTLPMEMTSFGAVLVNNEIYIFGGESNNTPQQHCHKLKSDGSWQKLASLHEKRTKISSSCLLYQGNIWVIGGNPGNHENLKSVEKYNISRDKWTYKADLNNSRSHIVAALFKDRILVSGGYHEFAMEIYDPEVKKWQLFCDLPFDFHDYSMAINKSIISIYGGFSNGALNSVWEMDTEDPEKLWTEKQYFKRARYNFGIGKLPNGVIIFGGDSAGNTSEIFDGNRWTDGPKLPQDFSSFAYISIPQFLEERFLNDFSILTISSRF